MELQRDSPYTLVGGFTYIFSLQFNSFTNISFDGGTGWGQQASGIVANQYTIPDSDSMTVAWTNPMNDMLNSMRNLAFRTALQAPVIRPSMHGKTATVPYIGQSTVTVGPILYYLRILH